MFGYIRPYKPELNIKEYDVFRAYYCGLCKDLGRQYGQISRLFLNYEATFLALFLSGLSGIKPTILPESCIANPFKKKPVMQSNDCLSYASDISIILTYHKFRDIKRDENPVIGSTGMLVMGRAYKKACKRHPEKALTIQKLLSELEGLERQKCPRVDEAAEPFANLMKEIFLYKDMSLDEDSLKHVEFIAYNLGRFIYIIDAYDDLEKDLKRGNYNPLLLNFNYNGQDLEAFKKIIENWVSFNLTYTLSRISETCNNLNFNRHKAIIKNILELGLYNQLETIMKREKRDEESI